MLKKMLWAACCATCCVACQTLTEEEQTFYTYRDTGECSYYHSGLEGGRMASGRAFKNDSLFAAHPSLPLGIRIRVTNLANDSTLRVQVADRGPYAKDRILDVSQAAARGLGFVEEGHTKIAIEASIDSSRIDTQGRQLFYLPAGDVKAQKLPSE